MTFVAILLAPIQYAIVFLYAPFMTFRAIHKGDVKDDKKWLIFWITYSAFQAMGSFLEVTYISQIVPLYLEIKFALLVFLFFGGAEQFYSMALYPLFSAVETKIPKEDLKLLEESPSEFVKIYGAQAFEKALSSEHYKMAADLIAKYIPKKENTAGAKKME